MTVRHDDDGTITVAAPVGLAVTDEVGLHPFAAVARSGGRFEVGAELTMRDGHLAGIALRSVAVDRAGLDVGRDGGPSLGRTTGDDEALSQRIVDMADHPDRTRLMGQRARAVAEQFDRPRQVAAYDALLREVAC